MAAWERVPDHIKRSLKSAYPTLEVRWSYELNCYQLIEHCYHGAVKEVRYLWNYTNYDGAPVPLVWDWLYRHICLSDTRRFPMMDRVKKMRAEKAESERKAMSLGKEKIADTVKDDWAYFGGIPTFYMGSSMQEARAKLRPSQDRALKAGCRQ